VNKPAAIDMDGQSKPAMLDADNTTLFQIKRREVLARRVLNQIRDYNIAEPRSGPSFTPAQAAELINRSTSSIRTAENEGRLPEQSRNALGRREGYNLAQLDHMREVFGTRPWRHPADDPIVLAVQNFKGGVGKSTMSVHLAQHLAIHGYRVLLIDADAQASSTMLFGYIPDDDFGPWDSIAACLIPGDEENYRPMPELIRKTHYHGLDLVPSNLNLYNAEYEIAGRMRAYGMSILTLLRDQIAGVAQQYDVVILDPPPALGMVSMSVLLAANALLIPMPPNVIDFASTTSFLSMLGQNMEQLEEAGITVDYKFIQIAMSRNEDKWAQAQIAELASSVFQKTILSAELKSSAEFGNATSKQKTVYDMSESTTNHQVRKRCLAQLNALNGEIEQLIRSHWPNTPAIDRQERLGPVGPS
jgi:chromosome partitioning protein